MRPLDKGACPVDTLGNPIAVADYDFWRIHLINRIGYYCAYCNMPLSHSLQVEHVVPKDPPPGYTPGDPLAWENMLLAYFPEENNTLLPFQIVGHPNNADAAIVQPANHLFPHRLIPKNQMNTIDQL